jgi:dTDP-4-amino-4,6-dideoxygalactose transaminase
MNVPFVDLKRQYINIKPEILKEINEVLDNTAYICGKKAKQFEDSFSKLQNVKYCVALSSGTDALHTALIAAGIKPGDEVIVPVNTFIATSEAVTLCRGIPVFVDHDERTYNIDVNLIEKAITPNTKAIIPVHLYGQPADLDPIIEIAKRYNLHVIEDCAQSHLALYKGKPIGGIGHIGTFSFYPGKNLGAYGEGGAVTTNNEELYNKMLRFRQHGSIQKYVHEAEGTNYRMEEIQAGVLNVKLKYLEKWTNYRRKLAQMYSEQLNNLKIEGLITPFEPDFAKAVYHLYIIRVKKRNELIKFLQDRGIQTGLHYPVPLHLQEAYLYKKHKKGDFPVAEKCCEEILSLPMFPELSENELTYVCTAINDFYA